MRFTCTAQQALELAGGVSAGSASAASGGAGGVAGASPEMFMSSPENVGSGAIVGNHLSSSAEESVVGSDSVPSSHPLQVMENRLKRGDILWALVGPCTSTRTSLARRSFARCRTDLPPEFPSIRLSIVAVGGMTNMAVKAICG